MCKKGLIFLLICLVGILFCVIPAYAQEDHIAITTYYPSPYGSYRELSAYRIKIGQNYSTQEVADGNLIVEGNVGIGITNPICRFQVVAENGASFCLTPVVGNYGNDVYSGWSGWGGACESDTCNGSPSSAYQCGTDESRTCRDIVGTCGRCSDGECSYRTVTCKKETRLEIAYTDGIE